MKILYLTEFFPQSDDLKFTGGVEAYIYFLARELAKKHNLTLICRPAPNSSVLQGKNLRNQQMQIIRVGPLSSRIDTGFLTVPQRLLFLAAAFKVGLKTDFDLVQGNNFVTYLTAYLLGLVKRKPMVAWYPDVFIGKWIKLTGFVSGVIGEFSERLSLKFPWSAVVALSDSTSRKLIARGLPEDKISTIYAGVDGEFFKKVKIQKNSIFTICCIARLVNYKRVDLLIKAVKILKDQGCVLQADIIGDGPEKRQLLNLINELDLGTMIKIGSNLSRLELAQRLKSSHLFCLPSQEEGFGLVIIEAAACGVPFVISNLPVLKEITQEGLGGLFFKSGNEQDLAKKILLVYKDKEEQGKLSKQSLRLANNYSWEKIAEEFERVYQRATSKPLKILMLVDAWFPHVGGGQVHVWEISKELAKKGCKVTIFTRDLGSWQDKFPEVEVIRVGHFKKFADIFGRLEYLILALFYSLRADYNILHAHAFSPGLVVPFVKLFRGKKTVFTVHGKGVSIAGLGKIKGNFLEDLVVYKIPYDLEITVAARTLVKKPAAKIIKVIPNGVDIVRFIPAQRERKNIKNILYAGRLSHEKGVDLLVKAFKNLNDRKLILTIVGDGPEMRKIQEQSKGLNVKIKGRLVGDDLIMEYKRADLLVLPSRTEGQPITLFEAWAARLPILVTRVGDNADYIKDRKNGFLCEVGVNSLRNKIEQILQEKNLGLITKEQDQLVNNYTWEKNGIRTFRAYLEIIG